jgi:hypothetical protein
MPATPALRGHVGPPPSQLRKVCGSEGVVVASRFGYPMGEHSLFAEYVTAE